MASFLKFGAIYSRRDRSIWALALVAAALCLALVGGPASAGAAVRPGADQAPAGVLPTVSVAQTKANVSPRAGASVSARPLGGYGWQTVTASSLTIRSSIGGPSIGTLYYGDQFYTSTISGSWCYGDAYYDNGAGYTYYKTGWVLCQYLTKN